MRLHRSVQNSVPGTFKHLQAPAYVAVVLAYGEPGLVTLDVCCRMLLSATPDLCRGKYNQRIQNNRLDALTMMVRLWQTCKSQPLQTCNSNNSARRSDPQCMSPQQTAAKQPLDEPPNARGLPQRLISKPQRQSVVFKRSHPAQNLNWRQVPKPALNKVKPDDKEPPEPREINHWLVDASSPEQVLRIFAQHQKRFNIINLSTALHRLAKVHLQA